ncbi:hypothetical protein Syun_013175 [Stephania yunnanensis]|uniref:Uncharacterized protein n=1 Tax=Stephania yunnanensis TaxID=152371 RepID=A0AAP0K321_9MAGN
MSTAMPPKVKVIPKLVKLDRGLKLAESWVNNMSGSAMDESTEMEVEQSARPARWIVPCEGWDLVRKLRIDPSKNPGLIPWKGNYSLSWKRRKEQLPKVKKNPIRLRVKLTTVMMMILSAEAVLSIRRELSFSCAFSKKQEAQVTCNCF